MKISAALVKCQGHNLTNMSKKCSLGSIKLLPCIYHVLSFVSENDLLAESIKFLKVSGSKLKDQGHSMTNYSQK